ncbi:hypothetical protein B0H12DRAFT_1330420 [Mycena haematopus]|nr:hypothetical protein B0H12DRAFT_1330420 [Mycena haematopus]
MSLALTFTNKHISDSPIVGPDGIAHNRTTTTSGLIERKVTTVTAASGLVGSINWRENAFEIGGVRRIRGDQDRDLKLRSNGIFTWIEPLLYKVIVFSANETVPSLLIESKSPAFLQNTVQHVYAHDTEAHISFMSKTFSNSSRIISLSLDSALDDAGFLDTLNKVYPQRLALTVPAMVSKWDLAGFSHPIFLSHWSGLAPLPRLTHVALSPSIATDILASVMAQCRQLVLAVVMTYSWEQDIAITFTQESTA